MPRRQFTGQSVRKLRTAQVQDREEVEQNKAASDTSDYTTHNGKSSHVVPNYKIYTSLRSQTEKGVYERNCTLLWTRSFEARSGENDEQVCS